MRKQTMIIAPFAALTLGCAPAGNIQPSVADSAVADAQLIAQGEAAFYRCGGCHSVEKGAPSAAGPNLYGVIGREAGSLERYPYTAELSRSGVIWDRENLDLFLADPSGYIPGSDMRRGAVPDPQMRAAIIAYLASKAD